MRRRWLRVLVLLVVAGVLAVLVAVDHGWHSDVVYLLRSPSWGQAVATVLLACLTCVYVVITGKLAKRPLELHERQIKDRQRRAVVAVIAELESVTGVCERAGGDKPKPELMSTHSWDLVSADFSAAGADRDKLVAGLYELYEKIRACNSRYEGWLRLPPLKIQAWDPRLFAGVCEDWMTACKEVSGRVNGVLKAVRRIGTG